MKKLRDRDLFGAMLEMFGLRRTASLLGYAAVLAMTGARSYEDTLSSSTLEMRTAYRVLHDYRELARVLAAAGYDLSDLEDDEDPAVRLLGLVA